MNLRPLNLEDAVIEMLEAADVEAHHAPLFLEFLEEHSAGEELMMLIRQNTNAKQAFTALIDATIELTLEAFFDDDEDEEV